MKTAISVPDALFAAADKLARKLGISRSELYARALEDLLARSRDADITARLNAVYGKESGSLPADIQRSQSARLRATEW